MFKNFRVIYLMLGISAIIFLTAFSAVAWQEPGEIPPEGNAPAPVNAGSQAQQKAGDFGSEEAITAQEFCFLNGECITAWPEH